MVAGLNSTDNRLSMKTIKLGTVLNKHSINNMLQNIYLL